MQCVRHVTNRKWHVLLHAQSQQVWLIADLLSFLYAILIRMMRLEVFI